MLRTGVTPLALQTEPAVPEAHLFLLNSKSMLVVPVGSCTRDQNRFRKPLLLVPNRDRAEVYLGLFDALKWSRPSVEGGVYEVPLSFRQLSRGLVWA